MDASLIHDDRIVDPELMGQQLREKVRPSIVTIGNPLRGGVATEDETQCACPGPGMVSVPVSVGGSSELESGESLPPLQLGQPSGTFDSQCVCKSGYEPSQFFPGLCTPCLPGYYKPSSGMHACHACPADALDSPLADDFESQQRWSAVQDEIRKVVDGHLPNRGPTADPRAGSTSCRCNDPALQVFVGSPDQSAARCACIAGYEASTPGRAALIAFEENSSADDDLDDGSAALSIDPDSVCLPCAAGTYRSDLLSTSCKRCPNGVPSLADGTGCDCELARTAPFGSVFDSSQERCACPPWTVLSADGSQCISCPVGTYASRSSAVSSRSCLQCPAGSTPIFDAKTQEPSCDCGSLVAGAVFEASVGDCGCPAGTMLKGDECVSCLSGVLPADW